MNDILPEQNAGWETIESVATAIFDAYGYYRIRIPIVERTDLYRRSIGEKTDIVEKEMYTFDDRNGDSLTLRPEATAGIVRAVARCFVTKDLRKHAIGSSINSV